MLRGMLVGAKTRGTANARGIWGLYGSYDYISPYLFRVSSTALSLGTTRQRWITPSLALQSSLLAGVGYGAAGSTTIVPSTPTHAAIRDYHFGMTPQALVTLRFIAGDRAMLDLAAREYYVSGLGSDDKRGSERIFRGSAGLSLRIIGGHTLGARFVASTRDARYGDLPNKKLSEAHVHRRVLIPWQQPLQRGEMAMKESMQVRVPGVRRFASLPCWPCWPYCRRVGIRTGPGLNRCRRTRWRPTPQRPGADGIVPQDILHIQGWRDFRRFAPRGPAHLPRRPAHRGHARVNRPDNHWYHEIATYGQSVGGAVPLVLSSGMFVAGKIAHARRLADLGKWGVEAAVLSTTTTWFLKGMTGRARPYAAAGNNTSFQLGRGFKHDAYASFPSGHTTAAFAMAAVLARGTADRSRRTHLLVSGFAFTTASIIGISRIYANEHWPSDIVVGAAVGTISGFAVVRASGLAHTDSTKSGLAYIRSHATVAPLPRGGMMLAFSLR